MAKFRAVANVTHTRQGTNNAAILATSLPEQPADHAGPSVEGRKRPPEPPQPPRAVTTKYMGELHVGYGHAATQARRSLSGRENLHTHSDCRIIDELYAESRQHHGTDCGNHLLAAVPIHHCDDAGSRRGNAASFRYCGIPSTATLE